MNKYYPGKKWKAPPALRPPVEDAWVQEDCGVLRVSSDKTHCTPAHLTNELTAGKSCPPTLVVEGGQQQEQARSARVTFGEPLEESIANFKRPLPKDGRPPWNQPQPQMADIAKAISPAASMVVEAGVAIAAKSVGVVGEVPKAIGGPAPPMPVPKVYLFAKVPPKGPPAGAPVGNWLPRRLPAKPPGFPPPAGNVVEPPCAPPQHKNAPRGRSPALYSWAKPRRPSQQQEGEVDLQGSLAPEAQVAEAEAAADGTSGPEVEEEGVAAPAPASVGPAPAHQGHCHNEQDVWNQNDWDGGEAQSHAGQVPTAQQEAQPTREEGVNGEFGNSVEPHEHMVEWDPETMTDEHPGDWHNDQEGGHQNDRVGEAPVPAPEDTNAQHEAQPAQEEGVNDGIGEAGHGHSQHAAWKYWGQNEQDPWNTEDWRGWNQYFVADDHGAPHQPQQNKTRFILMIHGRKLHRHVLFCTDF